MQDVVVVSSLSKAYGDTQALDNVSFSLGAGKVLALLGQNGAGKSTLLESLIGIRTPDSGVISLFGRDVRQAPHDWRQKIGVQLQDTRLMPKMRVEECLELFSSFYNKVGDIPAIVQSLGLEPWLKRKVSTLSGGWHQRLALALALINDPQLLILDEPTTGFDPIARREVWGLLKAVRAKGRSILLSTHYMEEAEQLADEIILIAKGRIIAQGTAQELKDRHGEPGATLEDVYALLVQASVELRP